MGGKQEQDALESLPISVDDEVDLPKWDGYDSCIVGMVYPGGPIIYDLAEMVRLNMRDGMSKTDAEEYVDFNMVSAYIGTNTPIYMTDLEIENDDE